MFESPARLRRDVSEMLDSLRVLGAGRYAAVFDAMAVVAESPTGTNESEWGLRRLLQDHGRAVLQLPATLHGGEEMGDLFSDWTEDEFLLAVVNGKLGVLCSPNDLSYLLEGVERQLARLRKLVAEHDRDR